MSDLGYVDIRPILARLADLDRDLVLVGGQAVNFWAFVYEGRVPALAQAGPFASRDVDFCGDRRTVRECAQRLGGRARVSTLDDATPNSGTVVFVDSAGVQRSLDILSAPFGLAASEVRDTAIAVDILDDAGKTTGVRFRVMHPVLSMESRVHNVRVSDLAPWPGFSAKEGRPLHGSRLRTERACRKSIRRRGGFRRHRGSRVTRRMDWPPIGPTRKRPDADDFLQGLAGASDLSAPKATVGRIGESGPRVSRPRRAASSASLLTALRALWPMFSKLIPRNRFPLKRGRSLFSASPIHSRRSPNMGANLIAGRSIRAALEGADR